MGIKINNALVHIHYLKSNLDAVETILKIEPDAVTDDTLKALNVSQQVKVRGGASSGQKKQVQAMVKIIQV